MYDSCCCIRLPGNFEVSLAVTIVLPAAASWVQVLEAQAAGMWCSKFHCNILNTGKSRITDMRYF
jgi:hypothetical protein